MSQAQFSFRIGEIPIRETFLLILNDYFPSIFGDRGQYLRLGKIRLWRDVDVETGQFSRPQDTFLPPYCFPSGTFIGGDNEDGFELGLR